MLRISAWLAIGVMFMAAGTVYGGVPVCPGAQPGVHVDQNSPDHLEVIPAEEDSAKTDWSPTNVRFYKSWAWQTPQAGDSLCWLYDHPQQPIYWEGRFDNESTEVWIQLRGCDGNDGVALIYVDGVLDCQYDTRDRGSVLIVVPNLTLAAHQVRIETILSSQVGSGDVSIDYVALPTAVEPKMHFPQKPDESGWDVNATRPAVVADDWRCAWTGPVDELRFWGSWKDDNVGNITSFHLSIHEDIPANWPQVPYSRPGTELWSWDAEEFSVVPIDPPTTEGWYDPASGEILFDNHQRYFRYDIRDIPNAFVQEEGRIYWLDVSANVPLVQPPLVQPIWGWKTSANHWNDDSVYGALPEPFWIDLYDPADPPAQTGSFDVTIDSLGSFVAGGGSDPDFPDWYLYEETGWWNVWFRDHVGFDWFRHKIFRLHVEVLAGPAPGFLVLALNWSTPPWSDVGDPSQPPLPDNVGFVCEGDMKTPCFSDLDCINAGVPGPCVSLEDLYIGRQVLFSGPVAGGEVLDFNWVLRRYNPEWVSIDVQGQGFAIRGTLTHSCAQSLDQAFVIGPLESIVEAPPAVSCPNDFEASGPAGIGGDRLSRFGCVEATADTTPVAAKVLLKTMYNQTPGDPDGAHICPPGRTAPSLSQFEGDVRYFGPPGFAEDEALPAQPDYLVVPLVCTAAEAAIRDWSPAALATDFPSVDPSRIFFYGKELVPCSVYSVSWCLDPTDPTTCNDAASATVLTSKLCDAWPPFDPSPGQPSFTDINATVNKYKGLAFNPGPPPTGGPYEWHTLLARNIVADYHVTTHGKKTGFLDIGKCVESYKHIPYNEDGPCDPSTGIDNCGNTCSTAP